MAYILSLPYYNDNIKLLETIEGIFENESTDFLYRTSELSELPRIFEFGTDRGGYQNGKMWEDGKTLYEDIIFGTTSQIIKDAELDSTKSSSFKKIPIISQTDKPIILIYDVNDFELVSDRQWVFKNPSEKKDSLKYIIMIENK